jgi:hypothetical protein
MIIRDFESGPRVFADDGAFAFGSRRDIELGARILYDHRVRWGMMPHTAGKTVAMSFGQPVANLREFLPNEAIPPHQESRWGTERRQYFRSSGPRFNAKREL